MNNNDQQLTDALVLAQDLHHEYESVILEGVRDAHWAGFYAAVLISKIGGFTTISDLVRWLEAVPPSPNWTRTAADLITQRLANQLDNL